MKLLTKDGELYILARSDGRVDKERAMRRRRLKKLCRRLHELQQQNITPDKPLLNIGAAKKEAGRAYSLGKIHLPETNEPVNPETFTFALRKKKFREIRRRGCSASTLCFRDKPERGRNGPEVDGNGGGAG